MSLLSEILEWFVHVFWVLALGLWLLVEWADKRNPLYGAVRVIDSHTQKPLAGALLEVIYPPYAQAAYKTDPSGIARAGAVKGRVFRVSMDGYLPQTIRSSAKPMLVALDAEQNKGM